MNENKKQIDRIDRRIVEALIENARMSMREIGERVHLSGQAVRNRIDRLEEAGVLRRYTLNVDCPVFGYAVHALLKVHGARNDLPAVRAEAYRDRTSWRVLHCYRTTGVDAYWFDMVFVDMRALDAFLSALKPICSVEVQIVLGEELPGD